VIAVVYQLIAQVLFFLLTITLQKIKAFGATAHPAPVAGAAADPRSREVGAMQLYFTWYSPRSGPAQTAPTPAFGELLKVVITVFFAVQRTL